MARRMQYLGDSVTKAADWVVEDLRDHGGVGGVIALDKEGNGQYNCLSHILPSCQLSHVHPTVGLSLNCPGMYRGVIREDGVPQTAIFDDEELS